MSEKFKPGDKALIEVTVVGCRDNKRFTHIRLWDSASWSTSIEIDRLLPIPPKIPPANTGRNFRVKLRNPQEMFCEYEWVGSFWINETSGAIGSIVSQPKEKAILIHPGFRGFFEVNPDRFEIIDEPEPEKYPGPWTAISWESGNVNSVKDANGKEIPLNEVVHYAVSAKAKEAK